MTTVDEIKVLIEQLTADLEQDAAQAVAEFEKLEKEIAEGAAPNLEPLKDAITALDTKAKAAKEKIPTA